MLWWKNLLRKWWQENTKENLMLEAPLTWFLKFPPLLEKYQALGISMDQGSRWTIDKTDFLTQCRYTGAHVN